MNCLLDTCALIWLVNGAPELGSEARRACSDAGARIYVSAATAWEMALKNARGKLTLPGPIQNWWNQALARHGLLELPITAEIAIASTALPGLHNDPADRLLIVTAQQHQLTLLTPDLTIAKYPNLTTLW
jgi:PIN domain nuclease of toxin-antitoxin system